MKYQLLKRSLIMLKQVLRGRFSYLPYLVVSFPRIVSTTIPCRKMDEGVHMLSGKIASSISSV